MGLVYFLMIPRRRILDLSKQSIHTKALLSEYQGKRIYLFDTNKLTAGKQLKTLLSRRTVDEPFTTMSDASAANFPLLKVAIRYRHNSLFYRTLYGANIGDAMMSLLHTAVYHILNEYS